MENLKMTIIEKNNSPKKIPRAFFRELRFNIDKKLEQLIGNEDKKVLLIEGYPKNILNALRRFYITHNYPNTCMRKGKLYIQT